MANSSLTSTTADSPVSGPSLMRVSEVLRGILSKNPDVQSFSVERILASIGADDFEASLMMFSLPAIVSVPSPKGIVTVPTATIACQMAAGHDRIKLPRFIRKKSVSRRSLAVAIHAILPVLEAAEKVVRPRWRWVSHSIWRRLTGLFVLALVVAIAFPLFGFNALHATSIFVISLGMAEKDGLAVMVGVVAGVVSLAMMASGISLRAIRDKVGKWLAKFSRKLGLSAFAKFMDRLGHKTIARILRLRWSDLLMSWDPERRSAQARKPTARAQVVAAPAARVQRSARPQRPGSYTNAERARRARASSAANTSSSKPRA